MVKVSTTGSLDAKLRELVDRFGRGGQVRVGFLENATYPDGTSVATVAAAQNFGAPSRNIPPRPFFSNMVEEKQHEWPEALRIALEGGASTDQALALLGEGMRGQLQQSIRDTNSPPLSPVTVERKGFDKPLIDKADMINSVGVELRPLDGEATQLPAAVETYVAGVRA